MTSTRLPRPLTPASRHTRAWAERLAALPARPPALGLGLTPGDAVLVVTAHPDDETLALGGTIAALAAAGVRVELLCATAGEGAYAAAGLPDAGLADRRRAELAEAVAVLGVAHTEVLGLPDGGLAAHEDLLAAEVGARLAGRDDLRQVLALWDQDPHPDHATVGRAAAAAAAEHRRPAAGFPLWAYHWTDPAGVTVDGWVAEVDADAAHRRRRAARCHRSQVEPAAPDVGPVVPPEVVAWTTELVVPA